METIEERLQKIEKRNERVEDDKAWETSWARKGMVAVSTYIAIGLFMWVIGVDKPFVNSIVPTAGFMLSTLTVPFIKRWWLKNVRKRN